MSDSVKNFNVANPLEEQLALAYASTEYFCKYFYPEVYEAPFSGLHRQIFNVLDRRAPRNVIAAPRGFGKTSIARTFCIKAIVYGLAKFIVYISNSATSAELQTENIKFELLSNATLRKLFGAQKADSVKEGDFEIPEMFSKKSWVSAGGTLVYPRGSGQQIRGLNYRGARPDLFVIDDLEDTETIGNEEIRKKRKFWFHGDVLKAVSQFRGMGNKHCFVYIDTLKHEDALLADLLEDPEWNPLRLQLCDDKFHSLAPEFKSDEDIMKEVDYHRKHHIMDIFFREFRNLPVSSEDATFQQKYFKYITIQELLNRAPLEYFVIVDPAKTVNPTSAQTAIVGIGVDRNSHMVVVRDVDAGYYTPDETINRAFMMCKQLGARVLGVEVTSLNEFITQPIRNEMFKRGEFYELIELKARAKKEDRIAKMVSYYRQGYVYHLSGGVCDALESQLLSFPYSKLWDIMDATAYFIEMLDLGERYFEPPAYEDPEEEYAELPDDEPLGDWRVGYGL